MFKKILVPTDGSALATSAATTAAQLAKSQGAEVIGVYVIDPFPYIGIGDASAAGLQAYMSEARNAAGQALDAIGKACAAEGVKFSGDTIERNVVYEGILETAKAEGCDLIVTAMVSAGAEVIADGNIHVYAPLRGRAMAGARGDIGARIYTTCLEAQLVFDVDTSVNVNPSESKVDWIPNQRVVLANLVTSEATRTQTASSITWANMPVILTEAGSEVLRLAPFSPTFRYQAGQALQTIGFTVTSAPPV